MKKTMLGVGITGSFCTLKSTLAVLKQLKTEYDITPIVSDHVQEFDTRFYHHEDFLTELADVCACKPITTIVDAEPIGPKSMLNVMMVLPCSGNTMSKIALGITDTCVTMAAKAHIRNEKPLLICVSTNDALGASLSNIATLYNKKFIYFAPMRQDDIVKKPNSLVVQFESIPEALRLALDGRQMQPLFR